MTHERSSALALLAGTACGIVTMALHPTGHDLFNADTFAHAALLSRVAHGIAIAGLPLTFIGALDLARKLSTPERPATAGLVLLAFAQVGALLAALVNGFIAPDLARKILEAGEARDAAWHAILGYNARINRVSAQLFVLASAAAIATWSAAIVRRRALAPAVGWLGLALAPALGLVTLSGHLQLNLHGFMLVVFGQAVWYVAVALQLWTRAGRSAASGSAPGA